MKTDRPLLSAGLHGAIGVGLGAFGAHALRAFLMERGMANAWDTAVRYQLLHAVALLALACLFAHAPAPHRRLLLWAARSWEIGLVLFSGSLYALALGGPRWLGPITPIGGLALIIGWLLLIATALRKSA